jgi:hypothetical protein
MPLVTDNGGGNGKKECAAGAALYRLPGIGKMAGRLFKSRLNKNVWDVDSETGTYQDCSCNHEAFQPVVYVSDLDPDLCKAFVAFVVVRVLISSNQLSGNSRRGKRSLPLHLR